MEINVKKALEEFEKIDLKRAKELREGGKELERLRKSFGELEKRVDKLIKEHYLWLCGK